MVFIRTAEKSHLAIRGRIPLSARSQGEDLWWQELNVIPPKRRDLTEPGFPCNIPCGAPCRVTRSDSLSFLPDGLGEGFYVGKDLGPKFITVQQRESHVVTRGKNPRT